MARKRGKHETCEGGGGGDGIHVDGCHGWDAWGHEVDEVGMGRWHVIGRHGGGVTPEYGVEGGVDVHEQGWGGKPGVVQVQVECGWWQVSEGRFNSSGYDGGDGVLWRVDEGGVDEDGVVGRACDPRRGGGGERVPGR